MIRISGIFMVPMIAFRVRAGNLYNVGMRAAVIHAFGGPEVLQIEERPEPVLRETDVLVEVHATSVNPVDTKVRASSSAPRALPLILGYDVSGVVVRCGSRVTQ